jgi:hypothetical protein
LFRRDEKVFGGLTAEPCDAVQSNKLFTSLSAKTTPVNSNVESPKLDKNQHLQQCKVNLPQGPIQERRATPDRRRAYACKNGFREIGPSAPHHFPFPRPLALALIALRCNEWH